MDPKQKHGLQTILETPWEVTPLRLASARHSDRARRVPRDTVVRAAAPWASEVETQKRV